MRGDEVSLKRRERRAARSHKRLHMLADRFYDETVSRKDTQGLNKTARMVGEREMESAYLGGSEYHRQRIEEFKPVFKVLLAANTLPEPMHNFS